jgi:hypothetical protein
MSEHDVSLIVLLVLTFSMAIAGSYLAASACIEKKMRKTNRVIRLVSGLVAFSLVRFALEALKDII